MSRPSVPRKTQYLLLIPITLLAWACTGNAPPTSMDQMSTLQRFTLTVEKKYKRESYKNDIDLHFLPIDAKKVKVIVTYRDHTFQSQAESIADAAIEHYRRLAREASEMVDVEYTIEKEVKLRPKSDGSGS